jgi:hypothetical protein
VPVSGTIAQEFRKMNAVCSRKLCAAVSQVTTIIVNMSFLPFCYDLRERGQSFHARDSSACKVMKPSTHAKCQTVTGSTCPQPSDRLLHEWNPSNLYNDYPKELATVYKQQGNLEVRLDSKHTCKYATTSSRRLPTPALSHLRERGRSFHARDSSACKVMKPSTHAKCQTVTGSTCLQPSDRLA